jgi:hypothetical protein
MTPVAAPAAASAAAALAVAILVAFLVARATGMRRHIARLCAMIGIRRVACVVHRVVGRGDRGLGIARRVRLVARSPRPRPRRPRRRRPGRSP